MNEIIKIGKELMAKGESFVIAKVVDTEGSTPRKKGAWLLMKKDGQRFGTVGGGKLEAATEVEALKAFETNESKIHHFRLLPEDQDGLDMRCGGDAHISIEYFDGTKPESFTYESEDLKKAIIFGAGHVGLALEPVLRHVGFHTIVADDREEYASRERFPEAGQVIVVEDFEDAYKNIETDEDTFIVIMTRGHNYDYTVLRQSLGKKWTYLGMIGSKSKVADTMERLKAEGFSEELLSKVHAPIGLKISSETPEEIGVSITAEMIQVRAGHGKG